MAQVETDGSESWMETETEDEDEDLASDCETKYEYEDLASDCETEDEYEDLAYDYCNDDGDDIPEIEREYWRRMQPVPGYGWTELGDRVKALEEAVGYRCLKEAEKKLKYLEALQSSYWSQHNQIYKEDVESAICNGSLLLSVVRGDEPTFTQKINELKEFYRTPFPYPEQFTFMRLNLVKLLHDDDDDDDGFDAAIDFLLEAQSNCFWKQPRFCRFFTVREVVSFLGANLSVEVPESSSVEVKYLGFSMEGSESSSVDAVVVGDIIDRCVNNLSAYLQKKGLKWEVWEFLESARDKWKKKITEIKDFYTNMMKTGNNFIEDEDSRVSKPREAELRCSIRERILHTQMRRKKSLNTNPSIQRCTQREGQPLDLRASNPIRQKRNNNCTQGLQF